MEGKNLYFLSSCLYHSLAYMVILYSGFVFLFKTQNTHLKSYGTFHIGQKTSVMEMKWFYDGFALMGVLHRGFPGKMSRQTLQSPEWRKNSPWCNSAEEGFADLSF